ncbi:hypothetical protein [Microbacterium lacticum]
MSSPNRTPLEIEDLIEALRHEHKVGPVQLAGKLREAGHDVPVSTIGRVLVRRGYQMVCVRGEVHLEGEHHGDHGYQSGARGASSPAEGAR